MRVEILVVAGFLPMAALGGGCREQGSLVPATDAGTGGAEIGSAGTGGTATGGAGIDRDSATGGAPGTAGSPGTDGSAVGGDGGGGASGDCPSVPVPEGGNVCGDILIDSAAAAVAAEECTEITGSLEIAPTFVGTIDLPRLRKVGKDVRREKAGAPKDANDPAQTTRVRLPNVTAIGGDLWFYLDFNLVELDLRTLRTITGRGWVYRDTLIRTLRLDALHTVGMDFYIADVAQLPDCVTKDIASHVTAAQTIMATGRRVRATCSCQVVCTHVEEVCP